MPDCWCTDKQFLDLGFGDYEEHAVLLCNYFNYIDKVKRTGCKSYLVLGDAHPEGSTTYVIRLNEDNKQVELWNAKTGDCFYFDKTIEVNKFLCLTVSKQYKFTKANSETICQLKSIGAIATFDNIYVNIQKESDPGLIEFDLDNPSNWKPFLTELGKKKYFPQGITTVQEDLEYQQPNEQVGLQLKEKIKEYLKNEIEKIRSETNSNDRPLVTNWELTSPAKIEKTLEKYEMFCFNIKNSGINWKKSNKVINEERKIEQDKQLKELLAFGEEIKSNFINKDIYGFPINLSFTTMREIWEQLKLTNVHLIGGDYSELCLSVYVNPLPANVNSVWVFFAVLQNPDVA
jgi:coiled-coil and C2 domain-containing protein 2A